MKGLLVRSGHEHHSSSPSTGEMPYHALQRTRPVRSGCNPRVPWAGSLGRSARGRVHVIADERLISDRFPRASGYHPEWVLAGVSGGANPLWLTEWLTESLDLRPGMRVLDLGCGRAMSSVFLRREFDVQVWATDLWFSASENIQRVRDAGVEDGVFPVHADALSLPFAEGFFDAVVSIDSFMYYGTDDMYLNYLARFVKPGGPVGIALAGLHEIEGPVLAHLGEWWAAELPYCLHSAAWWCRHWDRTGILDVDLADTLPDGWELWRDWQTGDRARQRSGDPSPGGGSGRLSRLRAPRRPSPGRSTPGGADRVHSRCVCEEALAPQLRIVCTRGAGSRTA